jgi:hypothetical protein
MSYELEVLNNLKQLFELGKTEGEIKDVKVIDTYVDDSLLCAEVEINGISIEFLYYDKLGFLDYWSESEKALNDLKRSLMNAVFCTTEENLHTIKIEKELKENDPIIVEYNKFLDEIESYPNS